MTLSKNNRISCSKALRRLSSKWNSTSGLGWCTATLRMNSHCPAKFSTSACERGSASMRFTCCCRTSGLLSVFFSATCRSSSSGMLLQRKNDSRDARSWSLTRYGVLSATAAG